MNREDATELAKRIKKCHFGGPPLDEWIDYLAGPWEQPLADETFAALRETDWVTFKQFGDKYRELARRAQPANVIQLPEPRAKHLTREERIAILTANGAPARFISPKGARL